MGDNYSYQGNSNKGLSPDFNNPIDKGIYSSVISLALNPMTANQVKDATDKLNTGAKSLEVQFTLEQNKFGEAVPDQHLEELNRLRKLTGVDLTLHGPMVEPGGFNMQSRRWDEDERKNNERQMWTAVERAHMVKPDGNIVVTVHSSVGLPTPEMRVWTDDLTEKEKKEGGRLQALWVVDERTGQAGAISTPSKDYLKDEKKSFMEQLDEYNKENWTKSLSDMGRELSQADEYIDAFKKTIGDNELGGIKPEELYNLSKTKQGQQFIQALDEGPKKIAEKIINRVGYGESLVKDSYLKFQQFYNQAYEVAEKDKSPKSQQTLGELKKLRNDILPIIEQYDKDKNNVSELASAMAEGLRTLQNMDAPKVWKPMRDFAIEKAAETFSNIAVNSYSKFGDTAPILSLENHPSGPMGGLHRAEDMRDVINKSRDLFVDKIISENKDITKKEAQAQAEKLIGATWDVGHLNMMRKYGYGDDQLIAQTETIAPYVKNIHLSDNFGMEHVELPMGMGNVPMQGHLEKLKAAQKDKMDKISQVIETGDWYQHFQTSPFAETLESYGSPIYAARMAPHWNQYRHTQGGYFAGHGMNPDVHHSVYGAGFSTLPVELGGQMSGRSRMSGSPID